MHHFVTCKQDGRVWTGFIWLRDEPVAGFYEKGSEPSGCMMCSVFLD
jgi:hypothetical protein